MTPDKITFPQNVRNVLHFTFSMDLKMAGHPLTELKKNTLAALNIFIDYYIEDSAYPSVRMGFDELADFMITE